VLRCARTLTQVATSRTRRKTSDALTVACNAWLERSLVAVRHERARLRAALEHSARLAPDEHPLGMSGLEGWRAMFIKRLGVLDASERDIRAAQRARDPWRAWDKYVARPRRLVTEPKLAQLHTCGFFNGPSPAHKRTGSGARTAMRARRQVQCDAAEALESARRGKRGALKEAVMHLGMLDPDVFGDALSGCTSDAEPGYAKARMLLERNIREVLESERRRSDRHAIAVAALARLLDCNLDQLARTIRDARRTRGRV
jgi:hypothetical protein